MIKPRKLRKNKYQESVLARFKGDFAPFGGFFAVFAWFCLVVALGAGLSQLYHKIVTGQWFKLEEIDITGLQRLNRTEVLDTMGLRRGRCVLGINTQRVVDRLDRLPVIDRASVRLDWRGHMVVAIAERKPVAVVECGGRDMLMDSQGVVFAQTNPGKRHTLPLMSGLCGSSVRTGDSISTGSLQHISELLSAVDASKSWLSSTAIDECRWSGSGFTLIMGQRGVPVNFGKEGFKRKLAKLKRVLETLNDRGWTDLVTKIDLDYPGRAYVDGQFPVPEPVQGTANRPG